MEQKTKTNPKRRTTKVTAANKFVQQREQRIQTHATTWGQIRKQRELLVKSRLPLQHQHPPQNTTQTKRATRADAAPLCCAGL